MSSGGEVATGSVKVASYTEYRLADAELVCP
jgi:hypothetical protein